MGRKKSEAAEEERSVKPGVEEGAEWEQVQRIKVGL